MYFQIPFRDPDGRHSDPDNYYGITAFAIPNCKAYGFPSFLVCITLSIINLKDLWFAIVFFYIFLDFKLEFSKY